MFAGYATTTTRTQADSFTQEGDLSIPATIGYNSGRSSSNR